LILDIVQIKFSLISTGPFEDTNDKYKTLKKMTYGCRDKEFLKLKLYALHEAKFKVVD
jgi:hypothetical protein